MADLVKTVNALAKASVKTWNALAVASAKTIIGVDSTGSSFSPTDLASLKRWLDASQLSLSNNDPVSTWDDQSGQANDVTQTGSARPTFQTNITNGLPGVYFSAASTQSMSGSAVSTGTAVTWWIVFQPDTISAIDVELFGMRVNNSYYRYSGDGNGYFGSYRQDRIDGYPTAVPTSGINYMVGVSTGATYNVWINGVDKGAQAAAHNAEDSFVIGGYLATTRNWNGHIFEFGMCDGNEIASRSDLETYLAAKWV